MSGDTFKVGGIYRFKTMQNWGEWEATKIVPLGGGEVSVWSNTVCRNNKTGRETCMVYHRQGAKPFSENGVEEVKPAGPEPYEEWFR